MKGIIKISVILILGNVIHGSPVSVNNSTQEIDGSGSGDTPLEIFLNMEEGSGEGSGQKVSVFEVFKEEKVTEKVPLSNTEKTTDEIPKNFMSTSAESLTFNNANIITTTVDHTTLSPFESDNQLTIVNHSEEFTTLGAITESNIKSTQIPATDDLISTTLPTFHVVYHQETLSTEEQKNNDVDLSNHVFDVTYHEQKPSKKSKAATKAGKNKLKKTKKRKSKVMETTIDPFAEDTTTANVIVEEHFLEVVDFQFNITSETTMALI